ncbi:hypothetical protein F1C58_16625 (plasmid) [Glaciihabitans sp. INWT7]|uniref:hypothetical protein n=1 Tax=Glaciihabitans sp. INWT7 TaxID=2596912 RepID=UPI0016277B98|nr:hypothetical protein [Glaciihabitans sp. INWT7]QNE48682.1 hypothetical protein F1C58_16625 [Glaciihabitans sp. INWT7]
MDTFNELDHPRLAGRFVDKEQSRPEMGLLLADVAEPVDEVNPFDYEFPATDPLTTGNGIEELARLDNWMIDTWIAGHPNVGLDTQLALYERGDLGTRARVVRNPVAHGALLAQACRDRATDIRMLAAGHANTREQDQLELAADPLPQVQNALLDNPALSPVAKAALRNSTHAYIQERFVSLDAA